MDTMGRDCGDLGPPPSILDMPPPPMPSYLIPVLAHKPGNNDSDNELLMATNQLEPGKPCKSICETDHGVGFVEMPQKGTCHRIMVYKYIRVLYVRFVSRYRGTN